MDLHKLDPALSAAVCSNVVSSSGSLEVAIRTVGQPDAHQWQELQRHGVRGIEPRGRVYTGNLSTEDVSVLSDKPWVRLLSLAQQMRAL